MSNLTINIPESALQQTQTSYEPLPKGKYNVNIFDVQADTVKSGENAGKPRWKVQLKVADGDYENRRIFTLIPLYVAGDFWKTQSFFEALGYDLKSGKFEVPAINDLLGKSVVARVTVREAQGEYPADNNISGFEVAEVKSAADLLEQKLGAKPVSDLWAD